MRRQALLVGPAFVARGLAILSSFLLTVTVARVLGPRGSGEFFLILTSIAVFATLGRFGTDTMALKVLGSASDHKGRLIRWLIAVCASASSIAALVAFCFYLISTRLFPSLANPIGLIAATAVVPQALSVLAGAILRGSGLLVAGTLAELGSLPTLTLFLILTAAHFNPSSVDHSVLSLGVASWVTAAWACPLAVRRLRKIRNDTAGTLAEPGPLHFGSMYWVQLATMMGTSILFFALTWAPVFVLGITRETEGIAFYTVAVRLAAVITLVPSIQIAYLAPAIARRYHTGKVANLNNLCSASVWQALAVAALPALAFMAAPGPMIWLFYGSGYAGAAIPLVLLTIAAVSTVGLGQVNQLMLLCDLEGDALTLNVAWVILWLTLGALATASGGATGAAAFVLASTIAYSASAALLLAKRRGIYSFARLPVKFVAADV